MTAQGPNNNTPSRAKNLAHAAVAAQAGCWTLGIVLLALFAGLWLDAQFQVRGPFTVGLLLISVPVSLIIMVQVALGAVRRIQPPPRKNHEHKEE